MAIPTQEANKGKSWHLNDAIALTGYGRFNLFVLLATGGCLMCVIMETMGMMYVIPAAECDLQLTLTTKGYLSAASFLGVVSASHFWGFLADTRGRKKIVLINMTTSFIMTLISSIVPNAWLFILFRFLNGLLISGAASIVYVLAGELHDNNYRPKVVSWISTFVAVGNMVLPAMAWCILPGEWGFVLPLLGTMFRPWRLLVVAIGLPSLFCALCIACIPESPKYLLSQGEDAKVLEILRKMFAINKRKQPEEFPVEEIYWDEDVNTKYTNEGFFKCMWKQTIPLIKKPFLLNSLMVWVLQFGVFAETSGIAMWNPEIFNRIAAFEKNNPEDDITLCGAIYYHTSQQTSLQNNLTNESLHNHCMDTIESEVFTIGIITGLFLTITYIAIGSLINILGKKNLMVGFLVVSSVTGLIAQYIHGAIPIKILISAVTISSTSIGVINAIVVDLYPTQFRAMALAISLMFGRIGAVVGSHITGWIFYELCNYTYHIFTIDNFVLIVVILLLPASSKVKKSTEILP